MCLGGEAWIPRVSRGGAPLVAREPERLPEPRARIVQGGATATHYAEVLMEALMTDPGLYLYIGIDVAKAELRPS